MLWKTELDCEASSWAEVFEAELSHLLMAQVQQQEFLSLLTSSCVPSLAANTPRAFYHHALHPVHASHSAAPGEPLSVLIPLGSPGHQEAGKQTRGAQIWWLQPTTLVSHAAGIIQGHRAHSSHWHSYRTCSQLWARSCWLRYCHFLHPDKTPVPVCSEARDW